VPSEEAIIADSSPLSSKARRPLQDFRAQIVLADARDDAASHPQAARVKGEIGGRAARLFARRHQVPKNLSDADDVETHAIAKHHFFNVRRNFFDSRPAMLWP
jgi:hypothetical protein